ncbi:MAG TPA: peptidoglycan-binding protein [Deltaproteobacteria bacterium]|nr:peptidoglycan-binding protein [Deltaproteobacteria bacterium]
MGSIRKLNYSVFVGIISCLIILFSVAVLEAGNKTKSANTKQKQSTKNLTKKQEKKPVPSPKIKAVQAALIKAGFKLQADGLMGPKTRAALKKYQKTQGLKVTGKPDKDTLTKLGVLISP